MNSFADPCIQLQERSLPLFFCTTHPKFQLNMVCTEPSCQHQGLVCVQCLQESHIIKHKNSSLICLSDLIEKCLEIASPVFMAQSNKIYEKVNQNSSFKRLDDALSKSLEVLRYFKCKVDLLVKSLEKKLKQYVIQVRKNAFSSLGEAGQLLQFIHQEKELKDINKEKNSIQRHLQSLLAQIDQNYSSESSLNNSINELQLLVDDSSTNSSYSEKNFFSIKENEMESDSSTTFKQQTLIPTQSILIEKSNELSDNENEQIKRSSEQNNKTKRVVEEEKERIKFLQFNELVEKIANGMGISGQNLLRIKKLDDYLIDHENELLDYVCEIKTTMDVLLDQVSQFFDSKSE